MFSFFFGKHILSCSLEDAPTFRNNTNHLFVSNNMLVSPDVLLIFFFHGIIKSIHRRHDTTWSVCLLSEGKCDTGLVLGFKHSMLRWGTELNWQLHYSFMTVPWFSDVCCDQGWRAARRRSTAMLLEVKKLLSYLSLRNKGMGGGERGRVVSWLFCVAFFRWRVLFPSWNLSHFVWLHKGTVTQCWWCQRSARHRSAAVSWCCVAKWLHFLSF